MRITYINLLGKKKKDESTMMKYLRDENLKKDIKEKEKNREIITKILYKMKKLFSNKIVKKNQVVLVAISLMLVTAGYLNYTNNIKMAALGDAQLVNANITITDEEEIVETSINNEKNMTNNFEENEMIETSDTQENEQEQLVETGIVNNSNEYFTKTKLERETMYSQMLDSYQKILKDNEIPNDQKAIASNEIKNINEKKNAIATVENLIKIKGISDVVVLLNGNSINVIIKSKENIDTVKIAQIQNIVSRELQAEIEDIHITTHE